MVIGKHNIIIIYTPGLSSLFTLISLLETVLNLFLINAHLIEPISLTMMMITAMR